MVVEDDDVIGSLLESTLRSHGHEVVRQRTGGAALRESSSTELDLVLLDLGLPDLDGVEVCRRLRGLQPGVVLVILTARDEEMDVVVGLEAGADDYLTKPFAFRELLARVRALSRRQPALAPQRVRVADLDIDLETRQVQRGLRPITLTAKEFALLEFFTRHEGKVVDRAAIAAHVWDDTHDPFTNVLEVLVRRLRRKIDDDFEPKLIHTIRGAGYRFGV